MRLRGKVSFAALRQNEVLLIVCTEALLVMAGVGILIPVLPLYAETFGVNVTLISLLGTLFGVGRLAANYPGGRLADLIGRKPVLLLGPGLVAAASLGAAYAPTYTVLLLMRVLQGVGSALYHTAGLIILADITTPENRGTQMSWYQSTVQLGTMIGPLIGGVSAQLLGFRAPFLVYAGLSVVCVLLVYFRLPETKHGGRAEGQPDEGRDAPDEIFSSLAMLRNSAFVLISLMALGTFVTRQGTQSSLIPLLGNNELGLTAGTLGVIFTLLMVANVASTMACGWLMDRYGRKASLVPFSLVLALGIALFGVSQSVGLFVLAAVVMGAGIGVNGAVTAPYVSDIIPRSAFGTAMGLHRTFGDIGLVLGPVVLGYIADRAGLRAGIFTNAGLILALTLVFWALAPESHRPKPKPVPVT